MQIESSECPRHTQRRTTGLVILVACIGALGACAGSHETEAAPATAATEPEPNSVLEKDRQMPFSRESPAPTEKSALTPPQAAAASPTPGASPTLEPAHPTTAPASEEGASNESMPPADPAMLKQDHRVIDNTAATSQKLANQTAAQTKNARDRTAVPAGEPKSTGTAVKTPSQPSAASEPSAPSDKHAADNTARNKRDQDDAALTPIDQSNDSADLQTTAKVRRAVMAADGLSFTARNVKIITTNGQVTLRGPVKTPAEKSQVEQVARQAAGAARVVSQLEVKQ
jgi:hyperosmotically inducible periplasmic protein